MSFKDSLVVVTSYPAPTPDSGIEYAVAMAALLQTQLSAVAFEIEVEVPGGSNFIADRLLGLPELLDAEYQKSADNARRLLEVFETAAKASAVLGETIVERSLNSQIAEILVDHARLRDLVIIPVGDADGIDHLYAERIVFGAGRPVMVLPEPRQGIAPKLDNILIAWDSSRPAARAIADAIPLLQRARTVRAVTVTEDKDITTSRPAQQLARHLKMHDVMLEIDSVSAAGREIGDVLADHASSHDADLLVMGAYGHSRLRDFVLGGATKSMLARPPLPLLLSH